MGKKTSADEIKLKVAFARQTHPHIAADVAEQWIDEGVTPAEASQRLYDVISEPQEASKIVDAYRATKSRTAKR